MKKVFENLKGTYDYLPYKQIIRENIKEKLQKIFVKYGFLPVETPIVCLYDLLSSKYSENADILKETYKLSDQGKRELGLRYDLTITFTKLISSNQNITFPFKRYEIGRVFRDGPIKLGRNREFTQCDVDIVGTKSIMAEAEYMMMTNEAYKSLDIDIEIEFNNRKLLSGIIYFVLGEISENKLKKCIMIIDKFAKIGKKELISEFAKINVSEKQFNDLNEYFKLDFAELKNKLQNSNSELIQTGLNEILQLYKYLEDSEVLLYMKFAPYLARGIDIYTGMVWEVFLKNKKINDIDFNVSIGGGGRYDKIITSFIDDGLDYPAVGMSFGLDVIYEILLLKNTEDKTLTLEIFIVPIDTEIESFKLVSKLREVGLKVDIDKNTKKVKKSISFANKMNIPFVIVIGRDEIKNGLINVKHMLTGENTELKIDDINSIKELIKQK